MIVTPPKRKGFGGGRKMYPPVRSSVLLTFAAQDGAMQQHYNNTAGGIDHGAIWASRSHRPAAKAPRTQRTGTTTDGRNNETDGDTVGTETRHKATATTTTTVTTVARTS